MSGDEFDPSGQRPAAPAPIRAVRVVAVASEPQAAPGPPSLPPDALASIPPSAPEGSAPGAEKPWDGAPDSHLPSFADADELTPVRLSVDALVAAAPELAPHLAPGALTPGGAAPTPPPIPDAAVAAAMAPPAPSPPPVVAHPPAVQDARPPLRPGGYRPVLETLDELSYEEADDEPEEENDYEELEPTPVLQMQVAPISAPSPDLEISIEEADLEAATPAPPNTESQPPPLPKRAASAKPNLPTVKTKKKPWWEEVFGDDFSRAYRAPTVSQLRTDADFMERSLGIPKGAVVLDLACGQGEYSVELNRRGYSMVGYDLSVFQLAMAADNAQSANQKINFLQGDMREMAFDSMFDALLSWNTSFGYFEEDRNFDVLRRMFQALKPGGVLLLEVLNRDYAAREAPISNWYEGDGCICMDDMTLDFMTSRLKVKRSVILDDGRSKEVTYTVRLYCLAEIGQLLTQAGFVVNAVSGSPRTPGAFLGSNSPSIIVAALKPA